MRSQRNATGILMCLLGGLWFCVVSGTASAQVNPAEITNPQLKAAETSYLPQITSLYRAINGMKTPFPLQLSRYVGQDAAQAEADSRGIEFVYFQNRLLLKISGQYNAAYSAERLTQNQRASRTFSDVIAPILALVAKQIPEDVACDGIGFEIAYHVRTTSQNFDYEGKEILVVVFDRTAAFAFGQAGNDSDRQEILNHSEIYLDGKEFALALGKDHPFDLEALGRATPTQADSAPARTGVATESPRSSSSTLVNPKLLPPRPDSLTRPGSTAPVPLNPADSRLTVAAPPTAAPAEPATVADAERLQSQFQTQLDALNTTGQSKFHFVDYAPPSFVLYRKQVLLQMTLRNTLHFSQDASSIYKRAAQSFDLVLSASTERPSRSSSGRCGFRWV